MALDTQTTSDRILRFLQEFQLAHPGQSVDLREAAKALNLSVAAIRLYYPTLAARYKLPPKIDARKSKSIEKPLLKFLQNSLLAEPNKPVLANDLARIFKVSKTRIWQLYHELSAEYPLPPVINLQPENRHRTRQALLKLLQSSWSSQPNTPVSLSQLAQTLNVSRERVRKLYRQLAREYALPPVKKGRRPKIVEIKQRTEAVTIPNLSGDTARKLRTPSPQTLALEAEVRKYSSQNMSVPEIARKIGRPAPTVYTALKRLGIPFKRVRDTGRRQRSAEILAIETAVRKYSEQGLSAPEIAKRTGRSESNIERIHHRLHLPLPPRQKSPQTLILETAARRYSEQGLSAPEIAKRTGRPLRTIYYVLHRLGIPRNYRGRAAYTWNSPETRAFEAEVHKYSEQRMTVAEIAKRTGRPVGTIYYVFRRLHLPYTHALRLKSPETRALEAEVRRYSEQGLSAPEIAKTTGRPRTTIYSVFTRLGIPFKGIKDTGLRSPKTLVSEAELKM